MRPRLLVPGIIILALLLTAGCVQPAVQPGENLPVNGTVVSPAITGKGTPAPGPSSGTLSSALTPTRSDSSGTGVWVRIGSKGDYAGTIGSGGWVREINGTGERFYQVPAASTGIVDIYLQNLDSTGEVLRVEVFNKGEPVERRTITTPLGTLAMAVDLKTAKIPAEAGIVGDITPEEDIPLSPGLSGVAVPVPHVTALKYKPGARYSACSMSLYLPDIVADPDYGLNGPSNSRLVGISDGQYSRISRESKETLGAINPCYKVDGPPYWTWLGFSATLNQVSSLSVTYNITLYANAANLRIPVVTTTETLDPGQDYPYSASIPIKNDQAEKITSMDFVFEPVAEHEVG